MSFHNNMFSFFRFFSHGALAVCLLGVLISAASAQSSGSIPADRLFPDSTKGFFSIRNLKVLGEQWRKTQIGTLMNDPIMEPFKNDLREQLARRVEARFGFNFDEIQKLPSGEVAVGMIAIPNKTPGYVYSMDVTDRSKETESYLERLTNKLTDAGVKRSVEKYKDGDVVIFTFPNAATADKAPEAKKSGTKTEQKTEPVARKAFYLLKNGYLLVSDQLHLVQLLADRLVDKDRKNSLADVQDYQFVMKRCRDDLAKGAEPLIHWYIEPLNYGESVRVLLKGPVAEKRRNKPSIFTVLKEQGFDAIRGIGGVVGIKTEDKEVVYRIFIYAKKPYKLAMRMLVFPDSKNFMPPDWMPTDLARCSMFYVDPVAIFDNFGTLFDSLVMQGETGVWDDIIAGLKEDPNGPQIDIREEIIVHLGHRILGMSKYQLPITPQSESIVIAVELKPGKDPDMNKALVKLFDNDTEMQKTKHGPYVLWHRLPAEDVIQPFAGPSGVPDLVMTPSAPATQPAAAAGNQNPEPMFPEGAITVAKGCLFVSTNREFLKTILDRLDAKLPSIREQYEYKAVDSIFANMGITDQPHFMQFFARTDETIRPTYELIRQGKMPQSQAILGKVINALLSSGNDEEDGPVLRQQAIDGSKLPEFDKIRQYFGPSGLYGASEENGYFFKGFLLEKKAEDEIGPARKAEEKKSEEKKTEPEPEKKEPEVKEPAKIDLKKVEVIEKEKAPEKEKSEDTEKSTFPISGKVTFSDGTPLTVGVICFVTDTYLARGELDKDGKYSIGSNSEKDGLPPGEYRIYISGAVRESEVDGKKVSEPLIDKQFTDPKTSPLNVVISKGKNSLFIEIQAPEKKK